MQKPSNYDDIVLGATINPGGHKCVIKKVEETKSQSGKDMIVVYFDTTKEDPQPNFFTDKYLAEKKAKKEDVPWKGRSWIVTEGKYGPTNLKKFCTAVEDSNEGFQVQWGDKFAGCFTDKLVGVVFRIEEYVDEGTSEIRASVKPCWFCDYSKALEQKIPNRKEAPAPKTDPQDDWRKQAQEGFMAIPDNLDDEGLPFSKIN